MVCPLHNDCWVYCLNIFHMMNILVEQGFFSDQSCWMHKLQREMWNCWKYCISSWGWKVSNKILYIMIEYQPRFDSSLTSSRVSTRLAAGNSASSSECSVESTRENKIIKSRCTAWRVFLCLAARSKVWSKGIAKIVDLVLRASLVTNTSG